MFSRRQVVTAALAAAVSGAVFAQSTGAPSVGSSAYPSQRRSPQGAVWNHDEVALLLIDYQPEMFANIRSETGPELIELNTRFLIRVAKALDIPVVLSTVGVEMGVNEPTRESIAAELPGAVVIDRSSMNSWEDKPFVDAVRATGRKRLVFGALYTEICLAFPVVDALKEGYEVTIVADAVGGMSQTAHATAIDRMTHAGAIPNTALALSTEFFRDWKSAEAEKMRPLIVWYLGEVAKLGTRR
ncbi:isochorismatase family protein [Arenimonas terrae]|nr:isochorismatase family protein [Arenimonas terrae]